MNDWKSTATIPAAESLPESLQDRLARILDEYLVAAERGAPISPQELLERYPADAPYLRGYLSGLQLFHHAAVGPAAARLERPGGGYAGSLQAIGEYQLVREIGRGGMGVVYEAVQASLHRRVALKVLPFAAGHDPRQICRFHNEAQAAAQVQHPNIVPVFAVGEQDGVHFYAMQLIDGPSLATLVDRHRERSEASTVGTTAPNCDHTIRERRTALRLECNGVPSLPPNSPLVDFSATVERIREVARLGIQAADALHAAHEFGIVHRDVKPSNLLLDHEGKLWVTDFGLARCRENNAGLTQSGDVLGTMRYMSPEQALGRAELVDHRTDVFSLGVTLYELATGHHPAGDVGHAHYLDRNHYVCRTLRHWDRNIAVDFQTIVLKAIAEFPHERYVNAKALADDLRRFLAGQPILASPPSAVRRAAKWVGRHRGFMVAVAAVLLVAFAGLTANMALLAHEKHATEAALAQANENLRQAHAVLDRFGTQLVDQLAAIPGAEGVRYQLLEDSLGFYRQIEQQSVGRPSLSVDLALAHGKLGSLSEKLGDKQAALRQHEAAKAIWAKRVAADPASFDDRRNLAICQSNVGFLLAELGSRPDALQLLREAEALQRRLLESGLAVAAAEEVGIDLAATLNNLGLVLRQVGSGTDAAARFQEAIAIQERLVDGGCQREGVLHGLAASHNNLASMASLDAAGADSAISSYRKAIEIQRRLVESQPINRIYRGDLARTYNNLGYLLARRREWDNCERCYSNAIQLQEQLVVASPLAASYRRDLAVSCSNLGLAQSQSGRHSEAEASFRKAVAELEWLLAAGSKDSHVESNLGSALNNLGMLLDRGGRYAEAEDAFRRAIRCQRRALKSDPETEQYRELLSNHFLNYARCLERQQKVEAAAKVALERQEILTRLSPARLN